MPFDRHHTPPSLQAGLDPAEGSGVGHGTDAFWGRTGGVRRGHRDGVAERLVVYPGIGSGRARRRSGGMEVRNAPLASAAGLVPCWNPDARKGTSRVRAASRCRAGLRRTLWRDARSPSDSAGRRLLGFVKWDGPVARRMDAAGSDVRLSRDRARESLEPVRKLLSDPDSGICDVAGEYIGIKQAHSTSVRLLSKRSLRRRYFARAARIGTAP